MFVLSVQLCFIAKRRDDSKNEYLYTAETEGSAEMGKPEQKKLKHGRNVLLHFVLRLRFS